MYRLVRTRWAYPGRGICLAVEAADGIAHCYLIEPKALQLQPDRADLLRHRLRFLGSNRVRPLNTTVTVALE
jgi:hypothetical protein